MISTKDILNINFLELVHLDGIVKQQFKGVSIDSRSIKKGEIFFAIKGNNADGHEFIIDAALKGAGAIVIERNYFNKNLKKIILDYKFNCPILVVKNTVEALGELAHIYRKKFRIPIIAVAGSNGKTTTKDMIASVLSQKYNVLFTEGNYNNNIGVPLTLYRLNKGHEIAVIEIGTNHFGEIDYLCRIVDPDYGLITNIGNEHLEFFKNLRGVAKEETSLFRYFKNRDGYSQVFVNADDKILLKASNNLKYRILYGIENKSADFCINSLKQNLDGKYSFSIMNSSEKFYLNIDLKVTGKHNVQNALAGAVVGLVFGVPPEKVKEALENFQPSSKRMEISEHGGIKIINDTYNANLDSTISAIETLRDIKSDGKKIFVFSDMLELGNATKEHHQLVGKFLNKVLIESKEKIYLFTYGKFTKYTNSAAKKIVSRHFNFKDELILELSRVIKSGDVILVKGSRGMKMEEIVDSLIKKLKV